MFPVELGGGSTDKVTCSVFLSPKISFLHPMFLLDNEIPFSVATQKVGDIVLTSDITTYQSWDLGIT